jgi:hypothetical protein
MMNKMSAAGASGSDRTAEYCTAIYNTVTS